MIIAVTYENEQVFGHFGRTKQFKLYTVLKGEVVSSEVVDTNGSGHGALAEFLSNLEVGLLICGGIGGGAQMALAQVGISIIGGVTGEADEAVEAFLNGTLEDDPENACCSHHDGEEHHCGENHCGEHGCGGGCGGHCHE